jgi:hypothetical protein
MVQANLTHFFVSELIILRREAAMKFAPPPMRRVFSTPIVGIRMKPATRDPKIQPNVLNAYTSATVGPIFNPRLFIKIRVTRGKEAPLAKVGMRIIKKQTINSVKVTVPQEILLLEKNIMK